MSQDWKNLTGAQAFHLIERHADGWQDIDRMMNEWLVAQLAKITAAEAGSVRLLESAKEVLSWTDSRNRPPVRDEPECGRNAIVRVHALADLHDAVTAIDSKNGGTNGNCSQHTVKVSSGAEAPAKTAAGSPFAAP